MHFLTILQSASPIEYADHGAQLLESASKVSPESMWGYTFAVTLLVFVVLVLVYIVRVLWKKIEDKDHEYTQLANETAGFLREVSLKLDVHDELKQKIEKVIDLVQEIRRE